MIELRVFVFLLFFVPARLVLPGFGAAGAPASIVGLGLLIALLAGSLYPQEYGVGVPKGSSPVLWVLAAYSALVLSSWSIGRTRVMSSLAASTSDRALIMFASLVGIAWYVDRHIRDMDEVERLVAMVLNGAFAMCCVGLVQFFTGIDIAGRVVIPGLVENTPGFSAVPTRSIFNRPYGTALHPIEFGVVSAGLVPLALWLARRRRFVWPKLVLAVLAFSAMASISRSAVLVGAVAGFVMFVAGNGRQRLNMIVAVPVFVVIAGSAVPGLVGTLRSMFLYTDVDPSIQARLNRTDEVLRLIAEYPWLGRGFGTFTIQDYLLLDNEIQKMTIETGFVGTAFFVAVVAVVSAAGVAADRRIEADGFGAALAASVLGIAVSYYTFDAFFYHILTGVLFLQVGLASVYHRLSGQVLASHSIARPDTAAPDLQMSYPPYFLTKDD